MQFFSSWVVVKLCGLCGLITVDALTWDKLRAFFFVSAAFLACVFANIKTLQYANVETFIVFRASTPLLISFADYVFLGRELPGCRSACCLLVLCGAAVAYVLSDSHFVVPGYVWVGVWYLVFCFDQLYIKHVVDTTPVESNWGRVFYTNLWASIVSAGLVLATEPHALQHMRWEATNVAALTVSCALSVGISYFAFLCRAAVSATCFTIIGNACKVITVLVNILIWDKHATPAGLVCLSICLVVAALYQQAPLRSTSGGSPGGSGTAYTPVPLDQKEPAATGSADEHK